MRFSNVDFQTGLRFEMIITLVTLKSCILTGLLLVSYQLQSSPVVDLQVCISSSRNPPCASRSSEVWMGWPSSWLPRFPCTWYPRWRRRSTQCWVRTEMPCHGWSAPGKRPCTWLPGRSQFHPQWPFWFTSELNQYWSCQEEKACHFLLIDTTMMHNARCWHFPY